jgi:hypothetical protein
MRYDYYTGDGQLVYVVACFSSLAVDLAHGLDRMAAVRNWTYFKNHPALT